MSRTFRNWILLLAVVLGLGGRGFASTTASIAVSGTEQPGDTNSITVAFNGFTETVRYGAFSTPASVASALAAMFSRDYLQEGLCANASGSTITLKLRGGAAFGTLDVTGSTASFALQGSGFATQVSSATYDTGTVTLTVSNSSGTVFTSSTNYGEGATPESVAEGLASSNSNANVRAVNDTVYIEADNAGSSGDYYYTLSSTWNSIFANPSFSGSPASGYLTGGANASASASTIYSYSIPSYSSGSAATGYDAAGNIVGFTDSVTGTWAFGYDTLNRLTAGQPTATTAATSAYAKQYLCWTYDSFGNRQAQAWQAVPCPVQTSATSTWVYNTANQVAGVIAPGATSASPSPYTYDLSGDVTADTTTGNQYLFDAEGRICAVQSPVATGGWIMTGYVYDAEGQRVAKGTITAWNCDPSANGLTDETDYILGPGGEQVTEVAQDADGNMQVQRTYVYAAGATIATYDPVANPAYNSSSSSTVPQTLYMPSFRLTDWLGTLRATTDSSGVLQGTCASLPYGDATACSGNIPDNHHFTGKERDTESGNDYFGARYYASTMGRWLSPDWSAKVEPVPYAKLDNPQTLNLYSYVGNNPLGKADPDGHYTCHGSTSQCGKIDQGVAVGHQALADPNGNLTVKQKAALKEKLDFLGSKTDVNGVVIRFSDKMSNTDFANTDVKTVDGGGKPLVVTTITFNSKKFGDLSYLGVAETEIHEGTHGVDGNKRGGRNPIFKSEELNTEHNAYETQRYVHLGLGLPNPLGKEYDNVDGMAQKSTAEWCKNGGAC